MPCMRAHTSSAVILRPSSITSRRWRPAPSMLSSRRVWSLSNSSGVSSTGQFHYKDRDLACSNTGMDQSRYASSSPSSLFGATDRYASSHRSSISAQPTPRSSLTPTHPRWPTYAGTKKQSGLPITRAPCTPGGAAQTKNGNSMSWCPCSRSVAKETFPRMKNVGAPWLGRSSTSGRSRQIRRNRKDTDSGRPVICGHLHKWTLLRSRQRQSLTRACSPGHHPISNRPGRLGLGRQWADWDHGTTQRQSSDRPRPARVARRDTGCLAGSGTEERRPGARTEVALARSKLKLDGIGRLPTDRPKALRLNA